MCFKARLNRMTRSRPITKQLYALAVLHVNTKRYDRYYKYKY